MVPPFDHEWIIAGQGTLGLEMLEQRPDVGDGARADRRRRPGLRRCGGDQAIEADAQVVGVEPSGAASMKASIDAGAVLTLASTHSIADGLMPCGQAT